jgi:uncharacterized protein (DUF1015 family)
VQTRSELVTLFHRSDVEIADQTARIVTGPPILDFTDAGGVAQSIWRAGTSEAAALARQLGEHRLYVADGHHRVAAATRLARRGAARADTVLCALYPDDQLVLHAFHRHVRGPVDVPALLDGLASDFEVRASPRPGRPDLARGRLGLYAAHRWWTLRPRCPRRLPGVAGLDVTLLDQRVLRPLLDVGPADPRLRFVPDLHDLTRTTESCDSDGGVLITLHAPRIEDIVSVAERREVMSPKSTYVLPKPRTGIFLG